MENVNSILLPRKPTSWNKGKQIGATPPQAADYGAPDGEGRWGAVCERRA
jgi:hypothetical protein